MNPASDLTVPLRRGACPSVLTPMPTGDGLLVRLRPRAAGLAPAQWRTLAQLAGSHGNGILDITARGNLQIRGLTAETAPKLRAALDAAGIAPRSGVAIETPPLSGLDPSETADAGPLAAALEAAIAGCKPPLTLAPKLAIVVDGGGVLSLADLVADLRLDAVRCADAVRWRISIAGNAFSARPVALLDASQAIKEVLRLLHLLDARGPAARGRDLAGERMDDLAWRPVSPRPPVGVIALGDAFVLGLRLPYGQVDAERLAGLADDLEELGVTDIRLAPHRALLARGLAQAQIATARRRAEGRGFCTDPDDPGLALSVCAGSAGCAAAKLDTHAVADTLRATAPTLLDGTASVHISGCPKGCAHPARASLTLVGTPEGTGLVLSGKAGDAPVAVAASGDLSAALARLDAFVRRERRPDETFSTLYDRLGEKPFETAFQGRT